MKAFDDIEAMAARAAPFGIWTTTLGARLFGHVPHVAPEAWFHELFEGWPQHRISALELQAGRSFHPDFVSFLQRFNGLMAFSNHLSMFGERLSYERSGDAARQPFDLVTSNREERPRMTPDSWLYIGYYAEDGSDVVMDSATGTILRVLKPRIDLTLNAWPSLDVFLSEEIGRLSQLFDSSGHRIAPEGSTLPDTDHPLRRG